MRAIAAVRLYVRVAEHPHRASLDVEPARVERGLKDLSRASARLRRPDRTPCVRGERARHAQGEEREADEANPSCHLPDAPRRCHCARASVSGRGGEERYSPFRVDVVFVKNLTTFASTSPRPLGGRAAPRSSYRYRAWKISPREYRKSTNRLSRGHPPPAWAPPPRRPRPWAPRLPRRAPRRARSPSPAAAAPAWAAPGWAARTS